MPLVAISVYSEISPPAPRLTGREPDVSEAHEPRSESLGSWLLACIVGRRTKAAALIGCCLLLTNDQSPPAYTDCTRSALAAVQAPNGANPRMVVLGDGTVSLRRPSGETLATYEAEDSPLASKTQIIPHGVTDYAIHDPTGEPITRVIALLPDIIAEASDAMTNITPTAMSCSTVPVPGQATL